MNHKTQEETLFVSLTATEIPGAIYRAMLFQHVGSLTSLVTSFLVFKDDTMDGIKAYALAAARRYGYERIRMEE